VVPSNLGGVPVRNLSIGNSKRFSESARPTLASSIPSSVLKNLPASIYYYPI
jgi:hypothetical protein